MGEALSGFVVDAFYSGHRTDVERFVAARRVDGGLHRRADLAGQGDGCVEVGGCAARRGGRHHRIQYPRIRFDSRFWRRSAEKPPRALRLTSEPAWFAALQHRDDGQDGNAEFDRVVESSRLQRFHFLV